MSNHSKKMQRDLKTGLVLGLVLLIVAVVWVSTRPSPEEKMQDLQKADYQQESPNQPLWPDISGRRDTLSTTPTDKTDEPETKDSNVPDRTVYEQAEKIKTQKFHIVRKGETLYEISRKYYGSANNWKKIFDANRNVLEDANKLTPGIKLIIPE